MTFVPLQSGAMCVSRIARRLARKRASKHRASESEVVASVVGRGFATQRRRRIEGFARRESSVAGGDTESRADRFGIHGIAVICAARAAILSVAIIPKSLPTEILELAALTLDLELLSNQHLVFFEEPALSRIEAHADESAQHGPGASSYERAAAGVPALVPDNRSEPGAGCRAADSSLISITYVAATAAGKLRSRHHQTDEHDRESNHRSSPFKMYFHL